jgi:hypothetical protein
MKRFARPLAGLVALSIVVSCAGGPGVVSKETGQPTSTPQLPGGSPTGSATTLAPPPLTAAPPAGTAAPTRTSPMVVYVGNTDNEGVYLRRTPRMEDRLQAYVDGTEMAIIGPDAQAEGRTWLNVRMPDGAEGWVPREHSVPNRPATVRPAETGKPGNQGEAKPAPAGGQASPGAVTMTTTVFVPSTVIPGPTPPPRGTVTATATRFVPDAVTPTATRFVPQPAPPTPPPAKR